MKLNIKFSFDIRIGIQNLTKEKREKSQYIGIYTLTGSECIEYDENSM